MQPAVFNKSDARASFFNYYNANKPAVQAQANEALQIVKNALTRVKFEADKFDYDFETGNFKINPQSKLERRPLLISKAMRYIYAIVVADFAKQCSDPSIPGVGNLTLQYCQAKLLKRSGAASIGDYAETDNSAFMGTGFVNFLQKLIQDRYLSAEQKAEHRRKLGEIGRAKIKEELPNGPEHVRNIDVNTLVLQPNPTVKVYPSEHTYESFDEVTINGKLFAIVRKNPLQDSLTLNLPRHRVIVLNPLIDCTFSIHAAEVYLLSKLGKGHILNQQFQPEEKTSGKITSQGFGVDFCCGPVDQRSFEFNAVPVIGFQGADKFAAELSGKIGSIFDKIVNEQQGNEEMVKPITDIAHMMSHALPFEAVKTRAKLPADMTEEQYKARCIHTNLNKFVCDFFDITPSAPL